MQNVPLALEHFRRGGLALLLDKAGLGHLILAAECANMSQVALMNSAGVDDFYLALTAAELPQLVANSELPKCQVVSTREGGLLQFEGTPEAAVDIARLAGRLPQTLLRAVQPRDFRGFAELHELPIVTVQELTQYRSRTEAVLELVAVADLPTRHHLKPFRAYSFRSSFDAVEHLALVSPGQAKDEPLVRIHSECLTGDAFGSLRCDCGPQLDESMRRLAASPGGILVYMRGHEGRGIGLANKMRAYALQDKGLDTVEANRALGLPEDARDFAHAAQILRALGHARIQLLTNNPEKAACLKRHQIEVSQVEPLVIPPNPFNARYLDTKAVKFGHALPPQLILGQNL
jgi:3,4-dihydroxy 2-butanone 4-phosphate synthase / GTP cyclohydrolase II